MNPNSHTANKPFRYPMQEAEIRRIAEAYFGNPKYADWCEQAIRKAFREAARSEIAPPSEQEIATYRDTFRAELDKRMDTKHPSASPSTESHAVALRRFVANRNNAAGVGPRGTTPSGATNSAEQPHSPAAPASAPCVAVEPVAQILRQMALDGKCGPLVWFRTPHSLPDGTLLYAGNHERPER